LKGKVKMTEIIRYNIPATPTVPTNDYVKPLSEVITIPDKADFTGSDGKSAVVIAEAAEVSDNGNVETAFDIRHYERHRTRESGAGVISVFIAQVVIAGAVIAAMLVLKNFHPEIFAEIKDFLAV
jgi:hypothetical protein